MSLENILKQRANNSCELCSASTNLKAYTVQPTDKNTADTSILICETCQNQIEDPTSMQADHWRGLTNSMWSEFPPVQIMSFRALTLLKEETWAQDLLGQMYLDDELLNWAKAGLTAEDSTDESAPTLDSNGTKLTEGDSVTLIKDLEVKGAGFTAKRGTLVRSITLTNNPLHIEGKVNGTTIVLVAKFLKKA